MSDGTYEAGWFSHPNLGLIKIFLNKSSKWVYQCYAERGHKPLSAERPLDQWTWALSEKKHDSNG